MWKMSCLENLRRSKKQSSLSVKVCVFDEDLVFFPSCFVSSRESNMKTLFSDVHLFGFDPGSYLLLLPERFAFQKASAKDHSL